jgi:prolipoprotein diacylglyceryltransferase
VLYSTARFIIEFYREHEQALVMGLSLTQWIALGFLALGAGLLVKLRTTAPVREAPATA